MEEELRMLTAGIHKLHKFDVEFDFHHTPQCECKKTSVEFCVQAQGWLSKFSMPQRFKELYTELVMLQLDLGQMKSQIEIDLPRTSPQTKYFSSKTGQEALRRVLVAFAKYTKSIGYIQGINFIAANLLWHAGEAQAFFLLVFMMEKVRMREIFSPGMPGVKMHVHILEYVVMEEACEVYRGLNDQGIKLDVLVTDWIVTLFANLVPLNQSHYILNLVFYHGWEGFYKLVLVVLKRMFFNIKKNNDCFLKVKSISNSKEMFLQFMRKEKKEKLDWAKLCSETKKVSINHRAVQCLKQNWRSELNNNF